MRHITRTRARVGAAVAAPIVAVLLLAGCSAAPSYSGSDSDSAAEPAEAGGGEVFAEDGAAPMTDPSTATDSAERSVITTGWMTILVDTPAEAADNAIDLVESSGGRIDGRTEYSADERYGGEATLTIRVPSERLTEVLDEIGALGEVQILELSASDVTLQVTDLDARISSLRASIDRLTVLLAQATEIDDLVALETAISDRQVQLESMLAEQRWLEDQVSLSTITVTFVSVPVVADPDPEGFLGGLISGWNALADFAGGVLVTLGFLLPWLIPLAIVGIIVLLIVWLAVRRGRQTAPAAAPPVAPATTSAEVPESAPPADASASVSAATPAPGPDQTPPAAP